MRCRRSSRYCRRLFRRYGTRCRRAELLLMVCTGQGGESREKSKPDTASRRFVQNRIYAAPEQFDFVWQYIVSHCPKGKIYE